MTFHENKEKTLVKIYEMYPDAQSADLGAIRGELGYLVVLKNGCGVFFKMIEPVVYDHPPGELFAFPDE